MDPYDRLGDTAQALLDASVAILDAQTVDGAPPNQFLTPGRPAFDCEFIAVQIPRLAEDATSPTTILDTKRRNNFGNLIIGTFVIWIVRCGPQIKNGLPPTNEAKTENSMTVFRDAWVLWNGIRDVQDDLFDDCLGVYFDGGLAIQEQGGYVGWQMQIRASIDGYKP